MHKSILLGHSQIYFIRSSSCPIWNVRPVAYDVQRYRPGLWSQNSNFSLQFRLQASTFFDSNIDKFLVPVPAPATERFALLKTTVLIVQLARPTSYDCGTGTKISGSSSGSTIKKVWFRLQPSKILGSGTRLRIQLHGSLLVSTTKVLSSVTFHSYLVCVITGPLRESTKGCKDTNCGIVRNNLFWYRL